MVWLRVCASMSCPTCNPSDTERPRFSAGTAELSPAFEMHPWRLSCTKTLRAKVTCSKAELDQELDAALKGTFPASDPVAIGEATSAKPDRPIDRKPALLDKELVHKLAEHVAAKQKELKRVRSTARLAAAAFAQLK
jgi:hypothetical protein